MPWQNTVRTKRFAGLVSAALLIGVLYWPVDTQRATLSPSLLADDGRLLRAYAAPDGQMRLPVQLDDVDPLFIKALIGYEDQRFYQHPGVDPLALGRALLQWADQGHVVSGGSTLTMQVARLLSPGPRTIPTKLFDIWRAIRLELQYSKKDILNFYLILAPYGGNTVGLRAASLIYFNKEPKYLTAGEIALLVVLPQNPNRYRPDRYPAQAKAARDKALRRLRDRQVISPTIYQAGLDEALPAQRLKLPLHALHLADDLIAGQTVAAPWHSTLDGDLQTKAEEILQTRAMDLSPQATIAVLIVDNRNHAVKTYIGNADYFDANKAGQVNMVRAIRSPGSTLKPFLYGMVFQDGVAQPETIIRDVATKFGTYTPSNFNQGYQGDISLREALQQSLNIPAVKILNQIGVERYLGKMQAAGLSFRLPDRSAKPELPVILGGAGCNLWDLVQTYSGLANQGQVKSIHHLQDQKEQTIGYLFNQKAAQQVTHILLGTALNDGTIRSAETAQLAIKTGTSYGYRDAWAVGYTPNYTMGVWVGRADGSPSPGQIGRNTAIPVLLNIYDVLPSDKGRWPTWPADITVPNQDLPANLQRWAGDRSPGIIAQQNKTRGFLFSYPVDNSVFRLADIEQHGIKLSAQGGAKPYHWYVNGTLLPQQDDNKPVWLPQSTGYYKITVQDSTGKALSRRVEVGN